MLKNVKISNEYVKGNLLEHKYFYMETYGCQMNVYDSELVVGQLEKLGYLNTNELEKADLIFLNTCSIREKAEETVHNRLSSLHYLKKKNPKLLIGLLGCMAQNLKDDILESKPYVDIILGPDSYRKIYDILLNRNSLMNNVVDTKLSKHEIYDDLFPSRKEGINAWISIMRGCDKFCTFCIVPFTRGRERSRSTNTILSEAKQAIKEGFVEITLLGQNVNSYSTPDGDFPIMLEKVAQLKGIKRIRYTSPHPQDINEDLLRVMSKYDNICNNIHLPLQSGSNRILKRMNRTYTREEYFDLVDLIKNYMPDCTISTDIIVGFPGETEVEYEETLDVVKKVGFNFSYMFKYSSRPGTKAAEFTDQIEENIKQSRLERLIELQKNVTLQENKKKIGKLENILIEKESKKSDLFWSGRTEGNIWTIVKKGNEKIKDVIPVIINDARGVTLFGENIKNKEKNYEVT